MTQWLDAYAHWPAMYQLAFSITVLAICIVVILLCGLWSISVVQALRKDRTVPCKWHYVEFTEILAMLKKLTEEEKHCGHGFKNPGMCPTCNPALPRPTPGRVAFTDWREESRQLANEARHQEEVNQRCQEEMEQVAHAQTTLICGHGWSPFECTACGDNLKWYNIRAPMDPPAQKEAPADIPK